VLTSSSEGRENRISLPAMSRKETPKEGGGECHCLKKKEKFIFQKNTKKKTQHQKRGGKALLVLYYTEHGALERKKDDQSLFYSYRKEKRLRQWRKNNPHSSLGEVGKGAYISRSKEEGKENQRIQFPPCPPSPGNNAGKKG